MAPTLYDTGGQRQQDVRITYAREYLNGARKRSVSELPPSVLIREVAELRRQLGIVLDLLETRPALDAGTLASLHQVFADAIDWRESMLDSGCIPCDLHPAGLCEVHSAHLDLADRHTALARDVFGIEVDR